MANRKPDFGNSDRSSIWNAPGDLLANSLEEGSVMRQAVSLCDSPIVGDYLAEIMLLFAPAVGLGCAIFLPIDHSGGTIYRMWALVIIALDPILDASFSL